MSTDRRSFMQAFGALLATGPLLGPSAYEKHEDDIRKHREDVHPGWVGLSAGAPHGFHAHPFGETPPFESIVEPEKTDISLVRDAMTQTHAIVAEPAVFNTDGVDGSPVVRSWTLGNMDGELIAAGAIDPEIALVGKAAVHIEGVVIEMA